MYKVTKMYLSYNSAATFYTDVHNPAYVYKLTVPHMHHLIWSPVKYGMQLAVAAMQSRKHIISLRSIYMYKNSIVLSDTGHIMEPRDG